MYAVANSNQASSRSSVAWIALIRFFHIMTSSYASIHGIQITSFLTNMNSPFKFSLEIIFWWWEQYLLQKRTQNLRNPTKKCFEMNLLSREQDHHEGFAQKYAN